jgi:hypothetical protein
VTVSANSSAAEFMDFYLDDDMRPTWDGMISDHQLLENGDAAQRCQVSAWWQGGVCTPADGSIL